MKIYKLTSDCKKFDVCGLNLEACRKAFNLEHLADWELYFGLDGTSRANNWWPRVMERFNDKPKRKLGDYIDDLNGGLILEKKAIDRLKPVMGNIEILPLICDFGDYWAINVMDVLACMDYENSVPFTILDGLEGGYPRIPLFHKHEFIKDKVEGYNIFQIINSSGIYVSQAFVDQVEKYKITGFKFELVWQSEATETEEIDSASVPKPYEEDKQEAIVTPLENEVMLELCKMKQEAYELIGVDESNSSYDIVNSIYAYIERLLCSDNNKQNDEEITNVSILLAAAWGFSVCKECNWEWNYLEIKGKIDKNYYIISPDHWYCCPPFYLFSNILKEKNLGLDNLNDNTVLLLFNMIKTLDIPTEKYTVIS